MNATFLSEISSQISQISHIPPTSIPRKLFQWYIQYLWYYEPNSWVARIAYSCRILALLISLPIIILGLLDITSYAIARTLGVVDDVKASTSDKPTAIPHSAPVIQVHPDSASTQSEAGSPPEQNLLNNEISSLALDESVESLNVSGPHGFYAAGSEGNLKLSGVDVFSPATSEPPSPTTSRRNVLGEFGNEKHQASGTSLRHRAQKADEQTEQ